MLFDLDRGCEIAIRALGGRYFTLEAGKPTGCNPLQREPTPARIQFWEQLIRTCIATPALPLLPADERAIADAVKAVAMMPAPLRRFSTVRQNLPKAGENSLFERLGRWCQGGALGWLRAQDCAPEFAREIFAAPEIGVLPRLVHSRFGLHVVEVRARESGQTPGFEAVRGAVALALRQQTFVSALRQYLQLLAGGAVIEGVVLDSADTPLVQ